MLWVKENQVTRKTADISETIYAVSLTLNCKYLRNYLCFRESSSSALYTQRQCFGCLHKKKNSVVIWTTQSLWYGSKWTHTFFYIRSMGLLDPQQMDCVVQVTDTVPMPWVHMDSHFFLYEKYGSVWTHSVWTVQSKQPTQSLYHGSKWTYTFYIDPAFFYTKKNVSIWTHNMGTV